jgi:hypothetical protein
MSFQSATRLMLRARSFGFHCAKSETPTHDLCCRSTTSIQPPHLPRRCYRRIFVLIVPSQLPTDCRQPVGDGRWPPGAPVGKPAAESSRCLGRRDERVATPSFERPEWIK